MDLNRPLFHHQIAPMRDDAGTVPTTSLAAHYERCPSRLCREMGVVAYPHRRRFSRFGTGRRDRLVTFAGL